MEAGLKNAPAGSIKVVVGRDARISGEMVNHLVIGTLIGLGIDVIDLGLSTTPTVEIAVPLENADGGIILTASHNPKQWNALKLLNRKGEFISALDGEQLLQIAENESFLFTEVDELGKCVARSQYFEKHIQSILDLPLVDVDSIRKANFKVVVDAVNSTGGIVIPDLLNYLEWNALSYIVSQTVIFPHNPEPLAENLHEISKRVVEEKADLGIVVDPDVDRLAIINEDGSMFGEEYTLVAVA